MNFWRWLSRNRRMRARLLNPGQPPNFRAALAQAEDSERTPGLIGLPKRIPTDDSASSSTDGSIVLVKMRFPGQLIRVAEDGALTFPANQSKRGEDVPIEIEVTSMGHDLYRLEDPWLSMYGVDCARFQDVIRADTLADGTLRFVSVSEPGQWTIKTWILGPQPIRSEKLSPLFERVDAEGGFACEDPWIGGVLWVFLPPESDYQPQADISACMAG
jgi:hypothetical protein